ncbi:MAG TPA: hypothetical protein VHY21_09610 [Pseudonocardiaceae bacterium]|jgi:hypothetical protein|nr:hypothetical protein [Pseudonocardiaceae bacterium]
MFAQYDPDEAGTIEPSGVALRLVLFDTDPISGNLMREGEPVTLPFCGWLDLMAAINTLRARSIVPPDPDPSASA